MLILTEVLIHLLSQLISFTFDLIRFHSIPFLLLAHLTTKIPDLLFGCFVFRLVILCALREVASNLTLLQLRTITEGASSLRRLNDGRRVLHVKVPGSQKRTSIAPFSRRVFRMITAIHPLHFPLLCASCFVRRIGYFRHVNLSLFLRNSTRTHIVCVFISLAVGQLSQRQLILLKI